MARRISEDEIKWILSLNAKGAQGEINTLTGEIRNLEKEQKSLTDETNRLNKENDSLAAKMEKLREKGAENSAQFQQLSKRYQENQADLQELTRRQQENLASIDKAKASRKEHISQLKLEDMTMAQLKARASELSRQIEHTSKTANKSTYKQLQRELDKVNNQMVQTRASGRNMLNALSDMNHPVGTAARAVKGFGASLKALAANPVGLVITAISLALKGLISALKGSDSAATKLQGVMNALNSVLDSLKRMATEVALSIKDLFTNPRKLKEHYQNLKDIGSGMKDAAVAAYEAALAEDALRDAIARNNDLMAVNKARISELRQITQDSTKSIRERMAASRELLALEEQNYKASVQNITGQYQVFAGKNKTLIEEMRRANGTALAEAEKYMDMVSQGTELTYEQRLALANAVNDVTRDTDIATEEQKEQFRQFFSELSGLQKEYFDSSRRDRRYESSIRKEAAAQAAAAEKKAMEDAVKTVDTSARQQLSVLNDAYARRELSQQDYEQQSKAIARKALEEKLQLSRQYGLDTEALEDQISQQQLADRRESDKKTLDAVKAGYAAQLAAMSDAKETELRTLERQHKLGQISDTQYANDRLKLDTKYAQARLLIEQEAYAMLRQLQEGHVEGSEEAVKESLDRIKEAGKAVGAAIQTQQENSKGQLIELSEVLSKISFTGPLSSLSQAFQTFFTDLERLRANDQAGWEDYSAAILTGLTGSLQSVASFAKAVNEEQTASLEAEKQKQLTLAGDNAEKREAVEAEYAQKELDLKKKQATSNAVIQTAQALASGALAIVQCFSQLGPIAGAVAAALVTATTAIQIATIQKQKQAILNTTLSSTGTSETAPETGARVVTGYESGGTIRVRRRQDGREYDAVYDPDRRGYIDRPTVIVGEGAQSREWVASNAAVENPTVAPILNIIDQAQRAGNIRTLDLSREMHLRGYAAGGSVAAAPAVANPTPVTPTPAHFATPADSDVLERLATVLEQLATQPITAEVSLQDLHRKESTWQKFKKAVSK